MAEPRAYLELIPNATNKGVLVLYEVTLAIDLHEGLIRDGDPRPELRAWAEDLKFFRDEVESHFRQQSRRHASGDLRLIHDRYFNVWVARQMAEAENVAEPTRRFLSQADVGAEMGEFLFTEGYFQMIEVWGSDRNPSFTDRVPLIESGFDGDWLYCVDPDIDLV